MNTIDFCFWLQGFFEISGKSEITPDQAEIIKNHLNLVFKHEIDPLRESQTDIPSEELSAVHNGAAQEVHVPPLNDGLIRC